MDRTGKLESSRMSPVKRARLWLLSLVLVLSSATLSAFVVEGLGVHQVDAVSSLSIGVPMSDNISTVGEAHYYQVPVGPGETLSAILDSSVGSDRNRNDLYVRYGGLPTLDTYDARGAIPSNPDQAVLISDTQPGYYYLLVYCNYFYSDPWSGPYPPYAYTITAHTRSTMPTLTSNVSTSGTIKNKGDAHWYQIAVGAGGTLFVTLDSSVQAARNKNDLYIRHADLPTLDTYDAKGDLTDSPDQAVLISETQAGYYYILVRCNDFYSDPWSAPYPPYAYTIKATVSGSGDINQDCKVDYKDLAILGAHYGETTSPPYPAWDINQDGKVDYKDLAILGAHYGEVC